VGHGELNADRRAHMLARCLGQLKRARLGLRFVFAPRHGEALALAAVHAYARAPHARNATATSLIASCQLHGVEPWAYLRDVLTLLPGWPSRDVLQLAPKFWHQTREQPETQQRLAATRLLGRFDGVHALESTG
jgi:hypothetical protein